MIEGAEFFFIAFGSLYNSAIWGFDIFCDVTTV